MAEHQMDAMPGWISLVGFALGTSVGLFVFAIVIGMLIRKSGATRELAELQRENARLREEIERLKNRLHTSSTPGSTGIKEL